MGILLALLLILALVPAHSALARGNESASLYNNRGVDLFVARKYTQAIVEFTHALELNPADTEAYSNRGAAYDGLNQPERAIKDYSAAININPRLTQAYSNRASALCDLGRFKEATDDWNIVIKRLPRNAYAYSKRAFCYQSLGNSQLALRDYDKAATLDHHLAIAVKGRDLMRQALALTPAADTLAKPAAKPAAVQKVALLARPAAAKLTLEQAAAELTHGQAAAKLTHEQAAAKLTHGQAAAKLTPAQPMTAKAFAVESGATKGKPVAVTKETTVAETSISSKLTSSAAVTSNSRGGAIGTPSNALELRAKGQKQIPGDELLPSGGNNLVSFAASSNTSVIQAISATSTINGTASSSSRTAAAGNIDSNSMHGDTASGRTGFPAASLIADSRPTPTGTPPFVGPVALLSNICHHILGNLGLSCGNFEFAIANYSKAASDNPYDQFAYFRRGNALLAEGQLLSALGDYKTAAQLDPRFKQAVTQRDTVAKALASAGGTPLNQSALSGVPAFPISSIHKLPMHSEE